VTPLQLLAKLTEGDVSSGVITIVEGWNWRQLKAALAKNPDLRHDTANLDDQAIVAALDEGLPTPEGLFFPDTYHFTKQSSELELLKRAHLMMRKKLDIAWEARAADLPLKSPYEALILASIIEKETGKPGDRPMIAAVFNNRLRIGMRLQTDPTVIYGLGERYDGNIHKRDLETDTAYNTYTRAGLTPTPIAMPGEAALQAAVNPANSKALYFVAKGDGSSHFSATLAEHNQAVRRYQLGGK
ncbi:endolytic transglycosylase MltG, partial [Chitinimonas sp.]|uniref:endolytic transglycosylase MltG n=1 Tax=Chitinimonas sp. TaxID=1934313 RepID=UPI0035ADA419